MDPFPEELGSSYVDSLQPLWQKTTGKAYAAGNIYNGKRVVKTCFKYTMRNKVLVNWACSHARSNGSRWSAGSVVSRVTKDKLSLNEKDQLKFRFDVSLINPNIH